MAFLFAAGFLPAAEEKEQAMTLSELRAKGITQFINTNFVLRAKLQWDYAGAKIPEDPTPMDALRKKAGQMVVPLEGPDFVDVAGKRSIRAGGKEITKANAADGTEVYAFKGKPLSNGGTEYTLKVQLKLRSGFKPEMLNNPEFIRQSNNPQYWSQTLELEIIGVE
ncbi:MAG: hypothetical protein C0404_03585 [Verrucomicrobia bacterium]|nr:hypothetical protein [Verrucomicrobiota bacterium]